MALNINQLIQRADKAEQDIEQLRSAIANLGTAKRGDESRTIAEVLEENKLLKEKLAVMQKNVEPQNKSEFT